MQYTWIEESAVCERLRFYLHIFRWDLPRQLYASVNQYDFTRISDLQWKVAPTVRERRINIV